MADVGACSLDDLDDLSQSDRQTAHARGGGDGDVEDAQRLRCLLDHRATIQENAAALLASDEHVLVHGHIVDRCKFLRDDRDPVPDSVP
jgi:hypothetical protein